MKYFIDTEFKEKPNTIDLISIGIVSENNKEYYALNKDCNIEGIWKDKWLRDNVLLPIYCQYIHGDMRHFSCSTIKWILENFGKTIKQIGEEIKEFVYNTNEGINPETVDNFDEMIKDKPIEFYGYYSDYDWVVFCWIFGRMIDLPRGFPMYCKDLKQSMDELGLDDEWKNINCTIGKGEHDALIDARWNKKLFYKIDKEKKKQRGCI